MKLILSYMGKYKASIFFGMFLKLLATLSELMIPYILEHLIDEVVPLGQLEQVLVWGFLMIVTAIVTRQLNVWANRRGWRTPTTCPMMCGRTCSPRRPTCRGASSTPSGCPASSPG